MSRRHLLLAAAYSASVRAAPSEAATWPRGTLRILVPFGPASGTDIVARLVGGKLADAVHQPVVVENKVGASGSLAAATVARATPDGSTFFLATQTTQASNAGMFRKLPYDPLLDFEAVTQLGSIPLIVVINPSIPARSVLELINWSRTNPGRLTFGYGTGAAQVTGELFKTLSGTDALLVPYKSNPLALNAVMTGEVGMMVTDPGPSLALIRDERVRALAVTTARRSGVVPDLPTMAEAGLPGYELSAWYAALLPARTPLAIRDRLHAQLVAIMALPDVRRTLLAAGIEPITSTPDELAAFMRLELQKWQALIKRAGITPE